MKHASPALSRRLLNRVLGLSNDASREQVRAAIPTLLARLRERLASADPIEADALRREISDLETSRAQIIGAPEEELLTRSRRQRQGLLRTLLTALVLLAVLVAYAAGYRITRLEDDLAPRGVADRAQLLLDGRLPGATLRVLDSDREELLHKVAAEGARIELAPGRYALDVSRDDCPDHWTRSVYFEEGATHRFEPAICAGEGELTVRSNVARDRLRIDGLDLGSTRKEPHLLGVGDHEVRVEKAGYVPFVGQVRIRPDEALTLRAELIAQSESSTPAGRPIPVEKFSPLSSPTVTLRPEPFDLPNLRKDFIPEVGDVAATSEELLDAGSLSSALTRGGSTLWHDRVSRDFIARYDLDRSGQVDRLEESESISCEAWLELERDFDGGGLGLSMARYYGFDGTEWHPNALGFARAHRSAVFEKMKECGLKS
jgi:hypothetical protein